MAERAEALALTTTVRVVDPETLRGWLVGETALPESNARLYYATALERMHAPDGQPMSAYAKAVIQERSAQIAAQYEHEAAGLLDRTRSQALELITDVADAESAGVAKDEILQRLDAIRQRVSAPQP